jgi:hypothetical protein
MTAESGKGKERVAMPSAAALVDWCSVVMVWSLLM